MGLFIILRHLVTPLAKLADKRDEAARQALRNRNVNRIPPHLRDDIIAREEHWRYD
ncbi:hypothetical protein [Martelella radicis]|uniref:Uncharacterized protein n=1 Tax=Martelella radicis TaxID=1397476 RepID=A0A7W6KJ71_9HYPH|nr:hypothetical protein [Martelella radicis]MBB4122309.1 hypothetical protein [Martelella radicis]